MLCARFNNKVKLGHDMSKQNCEGNYKERPTG